MPSSTRFQRSCCGSIRRLRKYEGILQISAPCRPAKKNVGIRQIEPVGNYAIRIAFDDGHDSGIYAWAYLQEMGSQQDRFWQDYLVELKQANASRLPNIPVSQWTPK